MVPLYGFLVVLLLLLLLLLLTMMMVSWLSLQAVITVGGEDDCSLRVWNPKTGECTHHYQGGDHSLFHASGVCVFVWGSQRTSTGRGVCFR
jgi:hypothetical protein